MTATSLPVIRLINSSEQPICAGIYESAWNSAMPHSKRQINVAEFRNEVEGELTYGSLIRDRLCGYISIWKPDWFIHHLYIDPSVHGIGIGRALLIHVQNMAGNNPLSLKCQTANKKALGFYNAAGFTESQESGEDEYGRWIRLVRQPSS